MPRFKHGANNLCGCLWTNTCSPCKVTTMHNHKNRTTTVTTKNAAAEKSQSIDQFKGMLPDFVCLLLFPTTASRSCPSTLPTQRCFGKKGGTKSTKVGSPASRGGHKHPASIREIRCSFSRTSGSHGKCPSSRVRKKMQRFYLLRLHTHGIHPYQYLLCSLAEKNLGKNPHPHATHTHAGHDSLQSTCILGDSGALVLKIITVRVR